ncbi:SCPU domain-containing protein [Pseudomonas gingeri NCPPB 3146 = LMG 5327]|uniref:Spore coat protein U domain-containing protein n=2 Tax=Pseudomonas gingeri TaxID=117681 RepID=A0A7Y7XTV3_9PSED|nr:MULTISPECIES: spore coat U domain-containing protein [Pseudomonas]NVZ28280.1 spore coat protein U domain-containing protein [Pseudomonas gingeri]NVZ61891.1 spore coat protein U domain-containing protein [Pseudomonas gingeri]NVZ76099.1 spore coat protein U domain-containing protein [Pseudomonas gingeri]NWA09205.1 spore coat protein U domain-containing protein [Pseudomonas gingeri]NWC12228.1 spore coat protein U domain-containing protein [Pseudomonas gingeri]
MKYRNRVVLALAPLLLLAGGAEAVMTGTIQARLVISPACEVNAGVAPMPGNLGRLDFGSSGPTWTRPLNAAITGSGGALQVTCNTSVSGFTVTIDGGVNGDGTTRRLSNGRQTIPYRLTVDAAGTDSYSIGQQRNFAVSTGAQRPIPVYGAVVANTNALPAGTYRDTLTVTLDW